MVERIIPADLDGAELWRRNGEYVSADDYEKLEARVAELEIALHRIAGHGNITGDKAREIACAALCIDKVN